MTIKMSDVFNLPLSGGSVNGDKRFLVDSGNLRIGIIDSSPNAGEHTATAINTYDNNQERIKELEGELLRQRQGLRNLIDLELIPASHMNGTMIEMMNIDKLLGLRNE